MTGVDADLATLRRYVFNDKALAALARVEAELSRAARTTGRAG